MSTNVPVHNQLGKVVDGISHCDESVQIVQSEVCQAVKQIEAADTFEHSSSQRSDSAGQPSQDIKQSGSAVCSPIITFLIPVRHRVGVWEKITTSFR